MEQNGDSSPVFLLPMAVAEGSPVHPAYPSGHAVNLGAYITALKVRGAHLLVYPTLYSPDFNQGVAHIRALLVLRSALTAVGT